jgi:hypothetical protein
VSLLIARGLKIYALTWPVPLAPTKGMSSRSLPCIVAIPAGLKNLKIMTFFARWPTDRKLVQCCDTLCCLIAFRPCGGAPAAFEIFLEQQT